MPLILGANSVSGYTVKNSLRFNRGSSDQLTRSIGTTGNRKTATYSCWIKKCDFTNEQLFLGFTSGLNIYTNGDSFRVNSGTGTAVYSTALQRDPSAWYHFLIGIDTTQATNTNRYRLYINGTELTNFTFSTYPTQNSDLNINVSGSTQQIGSDGTSHLNGYMSELYWIDGQQLTPSSFGETDQDTNIWKPKAYTGSFGTNGFYLQFKNSASLGTDSSGNGNTFTVNNLTSIDQSTDTPTNNFATMNPLRQPTSNQATFTNGNLTVTTSSNNPSYYGGRSTIGVSSGKWYFEAKLVSVGAANIAMIGIQDTDSYTPELFNSGTGAYAGYSATGWSLTAGGSNYYNNNSSIAYSGSSFTAGDIISVALDLNNSKLYFAKNGTFMNSGVPTSGATGTGAISITSGLTYLFAVDDGNSANTVTWDCNFGNPPYTGGSYTDGAGYGNFSYAVPSGYYSLNTKNLADYG